MSKSTIDIRKTGPQGYKQLQAMNDLSGVSQDALDFMDNLEKQYPLDTEYNPMKEFPIEVQSSVGNFGESMWDPDNLNLEAVSRIGDIRANNQWAIAKLGAGIGKGLVLAGTTFLDGTLGLAYGIGDATLSAVDGNGFRASLSKLWDNDVSNALAEINNASEELMPNYRTEAEQNNPWYKNLGTMNFWADSFIKNMGFTVGAMYSGKLWAAPLNLMKVPAIAGEITGSLLSAVNEGRIEANRNVADWKELQLTQLQDSYDIALQSLDIKDPDYSVKAYSLQQEFDKQAESIDDRANTMGMGILLANTVLLSYNNFKTFGKIYSGGFRRAAKDFLDTEKNILANRVIEGVEEGARYGWKNFTTMEGVKAGLRTGAREGLEEMNQAFISETAGNYQSPDSPDAYYNALINPESDIKTSNFLNAATNGFINTYGDGKRWEEFVVGGLTGLIGVPTVGKMENASANTYVGRNKWIGLSGGLFGEISTNKQRNIEGSTAVDIMNKYANRIQSQKDYFVQSQSFIDAMDRWSAENNAFEYKNAEDNDDFAAIASYARVGKLQDLKDIVNKDFENLSDEDLERIALYTSRVSSDQTRVDTNGWRDSEGKYLSETEDGRKTMRAELSSHRDKLLKNIDEYVVSVETVRGALHNSPQITEDQINELAWLDWKIKRFNDRFKSIKETNKEVLSTYLKGVNEYKNALNEEIAEQQRYIADDPSRALDETYNEAPKVLANLNAISSFIESLQKTNNALGLAQLLRVKEFGDFVKELFGENNFELFNSLAEGSLQYSEAKKLYNDLQDIQKITNAADQFNSRYKEFIEKPENLLTNRQKLEKKIKDTRDDKIARDLASKLEEDFEGTLENINLDEAEDALKNAPTVTPEIENMLQKLEDKRRFDSTKDRINQILNESDASSQTKQDVRTLLDKVTSEEDLFAFDSALYNDFGNLYSEEDASLVGKSNAEIESLLTDRLNVAKAYLNLAKETLDKEKNDLAEIDDSANLDIADLADTPETGNDASATVEAAQTAGTITPTTPQTLSKDSKYFIDALDVSITDSKENVEKVNVIVTTINDLLNKGKNTDEIINQVLPNNKVYTELKKSYPTIDATIAQYIMDKNDIEPVNTSDGSTSSDVDRVIGKTNDDSLIGESSNKEKSYWSPIQSMLPIHISETSTDKMTKFYQLVGTPGYDKYSEAQQRYIKAVGEYLDEKGAWQRIDNGLVHNNEEIHFIVDKDLNEKANAFIILITDKEGNILGNLPTEIDNEGNQLDSTFETYAGLKDFVNYAKSYFEKNGEIPSVVSHLGKWMIGKVIFTPKEEKHTAQDIFTSANSDGEITQLPITLAVAASDKSGQIRIVKDSARRQSTAPDIEILEPIGARNGQPFILYSTGNPAMNRKYVAVPVMMKTVDKADTQLNSIVKDRLRKVFSLPAMSSPTEIGKAKQALQEVLGAKFNIQVSAFSEIPNADTMGVASEFIPRVTLSIKRNDGTWDKIVNGQLIYNQTDIDRLVESSMGYLNDRVPYQMSLKYINGKLGDTDYNSLLAPYIEVNVQPGITHTVSNWFTINPLKKNDKGDFVETKAEKPKSVGKNQTLGPTNPSSSFQFLYKGINCTIDTSNWEDIYYPTKEGIDSHATVHDEKGNINLNSALAAAYAYGLFSHQDMSKPYNTQWGNYNPESNEFVKEEEPEIIEEEIPGEIDEPALDSIAEDKGLLIDKLDEKVWSSLSAEQKQKVLFNEIGTPQNIMEALKEHYSAKTKSFDTSIDIIITGASIGFRKVNNEDAAPWNKEQEISWLGKVLPQFSTDERLSIVDGLIKISNSKNAEYAWGQFNNGIIYIYKGAAKGTLYHEAFHAVSNTLLTEYEQKSLYEAAKSKYGNKSKIALEEDLAEDFRRYIQYEEDPEIGVVTRIFRKLKHLIQNLFGKDRYLNNMFYRISRGRYADRKIKETNAVRNREVNMEISMLEDEIKNLKETLDKPLQEVTDLYKKWDQVKQIKERIGYYDSEAEDYIKENSFEKVAVIDRKRNPSVDKYEEGYIKPVSKSDVDKAAKDIRIAYSQEVQKTVNNLQSQIDKLKAEKSTLESENALEEQDERDYLDIDMYYIDKYKYSNLSKEDKALIELKGLSPEEFDSMTVEEKENLFFCR